MLNFQCNSVLRSPPVVFPSIMKNLFHTSSVLREYVYLRGEPVALLEYETRPGWYFYVTDHLGTP